jgi:hypothetical protein
LFLNWNHLCFQERDFPQLKRRDVLISLSALVSLSIIQQKRGWATQNLTVRWRSPEELIAIGFERSRVVMMNEAHNGQQRNIRTREIGQRILPTAHAAGVRHLAMEALPSWVASEINKTRQLPRNVSGYLADPEMRNFIQTALDLNWTLSSYDIEPNDYDPDQYDPDNPMSLEFNSLREKVQAEKLVNTLQNLPSDAPLLVWCGNSHHFRLTAQLDEGEFALMGQHFVALSGIQHFAIDQTVSVRFSDDPMQVERFLPFMPELSQLGGTAGFLIEEAPPNLSLNESLMNAIDAIILSTENELE